MNSKYSLVLLLFLLASVIFVSSDTCYTDANCSEDNELSFRNIDRRTCCVDTVRGLSHWDGVTCRQCVVHGFSTITNNVTEGGSQNVQFQPNIKGRSTSGDSLSIIGIITVAEHGTARAAIDFDEVLQVHVMNSATVSVYAISDNRALEQDDGIALKFTPTDSTLLIAIEERGEYIRDTTIVDIVDENLFHINFEQQNYYVAEDSETRHQIRLRFQTTKKPFTVMLRSVSVVTAEAMGGLRSFVNFTTIDESSRATEGTDFSTKTTTITINPDGGDYPVIRTIDIAMDTLSIIDDDINELEQSFVLLAELGPEVPSDAACFRHSESTDQCNGRIGAVEIRIRDNDPMIIGFLEMSRTVTEGAEPHPVELLLISRRPSEIEYSIQLRYLGQISTANVEPIDYRSNTRTIDALFGVSNNGQLTVFRDFLPAKTSQRSLDINIQADLIQEESETLTIGVFPVVGNLQQTFSCNGSMGYHCQFTLFIEDDDEPFIVSFVKTLYVVGEGDGSVEVCVNLTSPQVDILDEMIVPYVEDYPNSFHIPTNSPLAKPDILNGTGMYSRIEGTDYTQQTQVHNPIDDEDIVYNQRIICYNQIIYDDNSIEDSEYLGLSLGIQISTIEAMVKSPFDQAAIIIIDDDSPIVTSISTPTGTGGIEAGSNDFTLTCSVSLRQSMGATATPTLHWLTFSGLELAGEVITKTLSKLTFSQIRTSDAGRYICQGRVSDPMLNDVRGTINSTAPPYTIDVILPTPAVTLSGPNGPLNEGSPLTLVCTATLPPSVNTDVNVTFNWTPSFNSERITTNVLSSHQSPLNSTWTLNPITEDDIGSYSCSVTVHSSSPFIITSSTGHSQPYTLRVISSVQNEPTDSTSTTNCSSSTNTSDCDTKEMEQNTTATETSDDVHCQEYSSISLALTGGLLGAVTALCLCITTTVIIILILKHRKDKTLKNTPSENDFKVEVMRLSSNVAYGEARNIGRESIRVSGDVAYEDIPVELPQTSPDTEEATYEPTYY